ncbi:uncharacterized protein LOC105431528 isoform X2 [Pogonomyrmex barbatus]|uniref:Uncharacterized protein LOC105431528 isoform X2 n=1 Tax=Pogonomyrmex barbatus TaxID=144034 RepID=A0A6I9WW04_9HYME|nr:uncharacterized protein LOC105431528 isoform X2 [Pogonomyrmex barbatus]
MHKLIVLLCLFHACLLPCEGGTTANRGYVFTAPRRFVAGETESGCLSLHNLEPPAHVVLELLSPAGTSADDEILTRTNGIVKTGTEFEARVFTSGDNRVFEYDPACYRVACAITCNRRKYDGFLCSIQGRSNEIGEERAIFERTSSP